MISEAFLMILYVFWSFFNNFIVYVRIIVNIRDLITIFDKPISHQIKKNGPPKISNMKKALFNLTGTGRNPGRKKIRSVQDLNIYAQFEKSYRM